MLRPPAFPHYRWEFPSLPTLNTRTQANTTDQQGNSVALSTDFALQQADYCAVCRPDHPWRRRSETCCLEHQNIYNIADAIRKGTAVPPWEPEGPEAARERWRNRATRVRHESNYQRHWLHCIVAQGGKCGDPKKDPIGKGCGRRLMTLPAGAIHVDHIVPQKEGGRDNWENCQALCIDCNIKSGDGSREDSPIQIAQRVWEVSKSPEIIRQAREQDGRCAQCKMWIWSKEATTEWVVGENKSLLCNNCGKREFERQRNADIARKELEIEDELENIIEGKKATLSGIFLLLTPINVAAVSVISFLFIKIFHVMAIDNISELSFVLLCFSIAAGSLYFVMKKYWSHVRRRERERLRAQYLD